MKFNQATFWDMSEFTSLPASVAGSLHYAGRAGLLDARSGPEVVPASPSAPPEVVVELKTPVTSGQRCGALLTSADLQRALESKLVESLVDYGSMEYRLIWRASATCSGRPICRLVASPRRIGDSEYSGWPTPCRREFEPTDLQKLVERRDRQLALKVNGNGFGLTFSQALHLTGWLTPTTAGKGAGRNRFLDQFLPGTNTEPSCEKKDKQAGFQVNPATTRWLMGYPKAWDEASPFWVDWLDVRERIGSSA